MAYYEFYKIPGGSADKKGRTGDNPWSEIGNDDNIFINYSLEAIPDGRGWVGTGPEYISLNITRKVKTHSNGVALNSKHIEVGDLPLYKIALLSRNEEWTVERGKTEEWPKVYIELDTQNGVRLRADLERLIVDHWSLNAQATENGSMVMLEESIDIRAWGELLENSAGHSTKIFLKGA